MAKILHNKGECFLSLKDSRLVIEDKRGKVIIIYFRDIIGAVPCLKKNKNHEIDFYFEVRSFGFKQGGCCSCGGPARGERKQRIDIFQCFDSQSYSNWQHAINRAVRHLPVTVGASDSGAGLVQAPPARRVLVVVNPAGGTGTALKIWKRDTEPMLQAADVSYTLLITERANHARDYVAREDVRAFSSVLVIGGDGLIFEVVSGIMSRPDRDVVLKNMPLAPIPGGSGNGLAMSVMFECGEVCTPEIATFVALKGTPALLDVCTATTTSASHFSFLSLSWGMVADVDINSESMRWMGEARFTVSGLGRVIAKKLYRGRLSMLLAEEAGEEGGSSSSSKTAVTRERVVLPAVTQPLQVQGDPRWLVLEDDFAMVWVVQTSHASTSMYTGPGVTLNDGVFTIMVVRDCSRLAMLSLMIKMETGAHFSMPELEVFRARAYRLEPLTSEGLYSLDGEKIEYGPFQAEMLSPSSLQVLKTDSRSPQ